MRFVLTLGGTGEYGGLHAPQRGYLWGEAADKKEVRSLGKHQEVFVKRHGKGWAVSKPNAERASGVFGTQAEAIARTRELSGGGTIHVQGRHGKFRKETVFDQ